ncbi:MAG: hypothetical protein A2293_09145 [Elusimicrobia bacterium RIFOXYB2_FULL_49_7]|nr:MAG: hypothetical protein A2293_09145 [Elusimicrobia bacterium RIFOXYB2_FULL_49_7]
MDIRYLHRRNRNVLSKFNLARRCQIVYNLIQKYSDKESEKILDIGTCDGHMLSFLKDKMPSAECFGIEPQKEFVDVVADGRISVTSGSAEQMTFPADSFDFVIMSSVIEHVEKPERSLAEVRRVLKKDGKFILITVMPAYEWATVRFGIKQDDHYRSFKLHEINQFVQKTPMKVVESRNFLFPLFYQLTVGEKQ